MISLAPDDAQPFSNQPGAAALPPPGWNIASGGTSGLGSTILPKFTDSLHLVPIRAAAQGTASAMTSNRMQGGEASGVPVAGGEGLCQGVTRPRVRLGADGFFILQLCEFGLTGI